MANTKKSENELDAVTAAYESISAKLEQLRKKREEIDPDEDDSSAKTAKASLDSGEDEEPIEEFDDDDLDSDPDQDKQKVDQINHKSDPAEDEEPLDPLPGTDQTETTPSKQIYQKDDPLDEEDEDIFKASDSAETETADERRVRQEHQDEMEKWEKAQSAQNDQSDEAKPTFTPLSQDDFRSSLRSKSPDSAAEAVESTSDKFDRPIADQPDSLTDLAEEEIEQPLARSGSTFGHQATQSLSSEKVEDDWGIRHLQPRQHSADSFEEESPYNDPPRTNFRRPPIDEDGYFEKRNQPLPRRQASIWHLIVLVLIGVGVIGATVYFLKYQFNEPVKPSPSPEIASATPVATPTPTPIPTIEDRSAYTVRVLNGTSKTGMATTILNKLKDAGFKTDRAGNATNSAFQQTVIRVKDSSNSAALINTIIKDLGSDYSPTSDTSLKTNDKADAEIILGQR